LGSVFTVRSDQLELLPQSSGKRGGGRSNLLTGMWKKGGLVLTSSKEGGRKQKVIPGLSGL
jgi:hypothetical protein